MRKGSLVWMVVIAAVAAAAITVVAQKKGGSDLATVPSVDLNRYAGKWYEIARYPNKFQDDCLGNTTAQYSLKGKGKIEVVNSCVQKDGRTKTAKGEAKLVDEATNAKLKVRFAPAFLSFIPKVWGDYWIIDLGRDYQYAVIGDPKREYFWILSREAEMNDRLYQDILRRAEQKGFQPNRVQRTSQKVEVTRGGPIDKS